MNFRLVLAAAVLLLVPVARARADTFVITPDDDSNLIRGSFVADTVSGTFTSSAVYYFPYFVGAQSYGDYFIELQSMDYGFPGNYDTARIELLQTASLQGYRGGPYWAEIMTGPINEHYEDSGVVTDVSPPPSVTREPPGLLLLGTGLLGSIGVARRRIRARGC